MFGNRNGLGRVRWVAGAIGVGMGWLGFAGDASARHFSFGLSLRGAPVWVPPVYETRARTIVEPGVYEERPRRVWHEPVYEERDVRIEIPAEVVTKRVPRYDRHGRLVGYKLIEEVVRPARHVLKRDRVLVRAGYYETTVERVCVRPEKTRTVYDEVLVEPGRWIYPRYTVTRSGRVYHSGGRPHH